MKKNYYIFLFIIFVLISFTGCLPAPYTSIPESTFEEQEYEWGEIKRISNLRQGPSLQSPVVSKLSPGTEVKILERQGKWYKILWDSGSEAYVYNTLVKVNVSDSSVVEPLERFDSSRVLTVTQNSNMRYGPGTEYDPPSGWNKTGSEFVVSGKTGNWYYGIVQGNTGWIHRSLLTDESVESNFTADSNKKQKNENEAQPPTIESNDTPPHIVEEPEIASEVTSEEKKVDTKSDTEKITSSSRVKVRSKPSPFAPVSGELAPGQNVQIISCQRSWCKIKIENGIGYIQSNNISQGGE